jgi:hypothetical protein
VRKGIGPASASGTATAARRSAAGEKLRGAGAPPPPQRAGESVRGEGARGDVGHPTHSRKHLEAPSLLTADRRSDGQFFFR